MEKINDLTKSLSEIKRLSSKILRTSLPIMVKMETVDSEYVESLIQYFPDLQADQILSVLQEITLEWIKDAESIKDEVERFIIYDEISFKINTDDCPFFSEVWNGDAYDKDEIDGLEELIKDLKRQLKDINEDNLLLEARKILSGEDEE